VGKIGQLNGLVTKGSTRAELTVTTDILLQIRQLGQGRVLSAGPEKVAEAIERDATVAALVEQAESLLVVGRSLIVVRRHCLCALCAIMKLGWNRSQKGKCRRLVAV
jgi:hypothetical protein